MIKDTLDKNIRKLIPPIPLQIPNRLRDLHDCPDQRRQQQHHLQHVGHAIDQCGGCNHAAVDGWYNPPPLP